MSELNFIPTPFTDQTVTRNGITFTYNAEAGTVTANGTATTTADYGVKRQNRSPYWFLPGGLQYRMAGCPPGGSTSTYYMFVNHTGTGGAVIYGNDTGDGLQFTGTEGERVGVWIRIASGTTVRGLTFKPCISLSEQWISPVTNRLNGTARMTYVDMNRITGNIAFLYDFVKYKGGTVPGSKISKTVWTQDDIITVAEWTELLTCLANICSAVGYVPPMSPTNALTYSNLNNIETISLKSYEYAEILDRLERMNHYIGDPIYSGDPVNAGGLYG